jgi:hypothetical protein
MPKYKHKRHIDDTALGGSGVSSGSTASPAPPPDQTSAASTVTTTYQYEPVGGADSLLLVCDDEFGYDTTIRKDSGNVSFNAKYDELVRGVTAAKTDLAYVAEQTISRMPTVRTIIMQAQYFTQLGGTGNDRTKCRPATTASFRTRAGAATSWAVDTYTTSTALQWPAGPTWPFVTIGTCSDTGFVNGARYLSQRGYKIGVSPVPRFISTNPADDAWEQWRGEVPFDSFPLADVQAWIAEYKTFVLHYLTLLLAAGLTPSIFYVGSEMRDMIVKAGASQRAAWLAALQSLADSIKAAAPSTTVVYAANYDEYSYTGITPFSGTPHTGNFALDAIWSYPTIDRVGVDWFEPLALDHTNDPNTLRMGVMSGENFEIAVEPFSTAIEYESQSSSLGLTAGAAAVAALDTAQASKALNLFLAGAHYVTKPAGVNAAASPLAGDWFGSATILGNMAGPATTSKLSTITAVLDGMRPPPHQRDCWLALNGTSDYGSVAFPTYSTAPTSYTVEIDLRYSGGSSTASRVLKGDVIDIFVDTTGSPLLKATITRAGGTDTSTGIAVVSGNDYLVKVVVSGTTATISSAGVVVETVTLGGAATMPASAGTWYFGRNSAASDYLSGRLYYVRIQGDKPGIPSYGGIYYFEESYAGVRSAWIPSSKQAMITAVGFASQQFSCVRPNMPSYLIPYPSPLASLSIQLQDSDPMKAYWAEFIPQGLTVGEVHIPYGGNGIPDEDHQAICLDVTVKALKGQGVVSVVAFYVDARPFDAITATYVSGGVDTLYYYYGPACAIDHSLGGKKAAGD